MKSLRYPVPAEETRTTYQVKDSRFIITGAHAESVEEAQLWIEGIREEFRDATHNCPAYRIGYGGSVKEWASDDGEPRGTAGKPMLSVLQGHDIGDIVVVVTRYFGGTKLGTGGLVRAYSGAVRALLDVLPTKMKIERLNRTLIVDYASYEKIKELLLHHEALIQEELFAENITFRFTLPLDQLENFEKTLTELSLGRFKMQEA